MKHNIELNNSFELNNAVRDNVVIKDEAKFKQMVEICSALFAGTDAGKYGAQKDAVVKKRPVKKLYFFIVSALHSV